MPIFYRILLLTGLAVACWPATAASPQASKYYEDALVRYERKDLAGAIVQLKNAIQADQSMLTARMLLGKALLASGDAAGAEVEFDEALRLGVSRDEALALLGQTYLLQGKFDTLLERVTPGGLSLSQQIDVLLLRANAQAEKDGIAPALSTLQEALSLDPRSVPVRLALATLNMRKGDLPLAGRLIDEALAQAPNNSPAWHLRGSLLQASGDPQGALAAYTKATTLSPGYADPRIARAGLLIELGRTEEAGHELTAISKMAPFDPRASYMRAQVATRQGDRAATKAALEEVTRLLDPIPPAILANNKQMLLINALAHYDLGNREKSSAKLGIYMRRYPGDTAGSTLLARQHLDAGNHSGAILLLEQLRRKSPNDPRILALLGVAQMQGGNHRAASDLLDKAARMSGGAADILTDLGISLANSGKTDLAIEALRQSWTKDPRQTRSGLILGSLYLRAGQPGKALEVMDSLIRIDPSNVAALNMRGIALSATGDRSGARKAYEQVIARHPNHPGATLNLSALDVADGKPAAAHQRLLGLLKADDKNVDAMMEIAVIEEKANRQDEAIRWLEKARAQPAAAVTGGIRLAELHMRTGAIDKALSTARDVLTRAPDNLSALALVARLQLAKGDNKAARQTLSDMARYANYDPAAQLEVARLQLAAGNPSGANYSLDKALGTQPDYLPALILRAEIDIVQREFTRAEQRIRQIGERPQNATTTLRLQGDLAMARGQQGAALSAYNNALKREDSPELALRVFRAHAQAGDLRKGATFLDSWLIRNPNNTAALRALGDAELQQGNHANARKAYEKLLRLQPDNALVLNNLAHSAFALKDPAAKGFAERAYALRPADPVIIDTLGWILFHDGQNDRALALLRDARLRDSANPEIRYHLAAALARSGRTTEARDEITQALKTGNTFPGIDKARQLQAELFR